MNLPPRIVDALLATLENVRKPLDAAHVAGLFVASALDEFVKTTGAASHEIGLAISAIENLRDQDIHGAKTPRPIPTPVPFPPGATPPRGLKAPPRNRR